MIAFYAIVRLHFLIDFYQIGRLFIVQRTKVQCPSGGRHAPRRLFRRRDGGYSMRMFETATSLALAIASQVLAVGVIVTF
ncbi:hypothetical protein SAMN06295912_10668 [Sphingomonas laterariae]|uniref:Uncharacterized protein n=1 Tax=Edaphosphingomonas laterariae TaxID=861865 RepID=A0A239ECG8_9SPHN|nr:hypothetical protein [Sphingomonas laterariae]SNS42326.1 hypothetical protein SAMN06295912_10668 [Sphingomonas laterariae]